MTKQYDRKLFVILGVFFLLLAILFNVATISTRTFPAGHDLMLLAMTVMCFCNAYLAPQFVQNDERTKKIRERSMFYSYIMNIGFIIVMLTVLYFDILDVTAYQAVAILGALIIVTSFLTMVVLSKRY
ncbi:hypothetical protein SH601_12195 [Gracilibacillus sp. S3-1-1]|uniref:Uncharacterized protein n=1 Tax=Gracilibacillus pellucidus TaxID=3095368 RepID=A0ACC6M7A3_9BACI|nr:hypothetical protein [Gracilibacillus sp. S3-1-1]MDX8046743.1 hypothetical protein [Gracilibacillus sp. S3-1-1]